jgi:hypothetical protein
LTASSKSSPRHPVVTGERDALLDVAILVVPKLDGARHGIAMPVDKLAA